LLALLALGAMSLLAGCGGGGAQDPFDRPTVPTLTVNPGVVTLYANIPAVVTVTSGTAPFQVFSSNATVLPVNPVVGGTLITLTPSNVDVDTDVTITVRDGSGQSRALTATVKPATLVNQVAITPIITNPRCGVESTPAPPGQTTGNQIAVCTGETVTASAILRAANASPIPNRQVRFDVIFGAFLFVTDSAGANASKTTTGTTDQNGRVTTLFKVDPAATSQSAVIRVTDLVTGNRVDTAFSIVSVTNGSAGYTAIPSGYSGKAFYKGECGGTSGDFLIYGGQPPYTVRSSLTAVRLSVNGVTSDPVIVTSSGGRFTASTALQGCSGGFESNIVITDANGRNITVTYKEEEGSNDRVVPTPTDLVASPKAVIFNSCATPRSVTYSIVGGTAPYIVRTDRPAESSVNQATVSLVAGFSGVLNVEITDSKSNQVTATITCP
jgi:hypothetical protein